MIDVLLETHPSPRNVM